MCRSNKDETEHSLCILIMLTIYVCRQIRDAETRAHVRLSTHSFQSRCIDLRRTCTLTLLVYIYVQRFFCRWIDFMRKESLTTKRSCKYADVFISLQPKPFFIYTMIYFLSSLTILYTHSQRHTKNLKT